MQDILTHLPDLPSHQTSFHQPSMRQTVQRQTPNKHLQCLGITVAEPESDLM